MQVASPRRDEQPQRKAGERGRLQRREGGRLRSRGRQQLRQSRRACGAPQPRYPAAAEERAPGLRARGRRRPFKGSEKPGAPGPLRHPVAPLRRQIGGCLHTPLLHVPAAAPPDAGGGPGSESENGPHQQSC